MDKGKLHWPEALVKHTNDVIVCFTNAGFINQSKIDELMPFCAK